MCHVSYLDSFGQNVSRLRQEEGRHGLLVSQGGIEDVERLSKDSFHLALH